MVYSSARRQVRDSHLAEDVPQAVFMLLVRKARAIRQDVALSGWLFITTHYDLPDPCVTSVGAFLFAPLSAGAEGSTKLHIATDYAGDDDLTVFAKDLAGTAHYCRNVWINTVGKLKTYTYQFEIPPEQVASLVVKTRKLDTLVTAKNITLDPADPHPIDLKVAKAP